MLLCPFTYVFHISYSTTLHLIHTTTQASFSRCHFLSWHLVLSAFRLAAACLLINKSKFVLDSNEGEPTKSYMILVLK
jgi:hypothetical protein